MIGASIWHFNACSWQNSWSWAFQLTHQHFFRLVVHSYSRPAELHSSPALLSPSSSCSSSTAFSSDFSSWSSKPSPLLPVLQSSSLPGLQTLERWCEIPPGTYWMFLAWSFIFSVEPRLSHCQSGVLGQCFGRFFLQLFVVFPFGSCTDWVYFGSIRSSGSCFLQLPIGCFHLSCSNLTAFLNLHYVWFYFSVLALQYFLLV